MLEKETDEFKLLHNYNNQTHIHTFSKQTHIYQTHLYFTMLSKLPDDKHSVFAKGRIFPDPTQIFKTDDELQIPLGTAVEIENMKTNLIHKE